MSTPAKALLNGVKYDGDKLDWSLLQFGAIEEVLKVLGYGAKKYDRHNWKKLDNLDERYLTAAFRHLSAEMQGERLDPESGLPHIAHAMTGLMFVMQNRLNNLKGETK